MASMAARAATARLGGEAGAADGAGEADGAEGVDVAEGVDEAEEVDRGGGVGGGGERAGATVAIWSRRSMSCLTERTKSPGVRSGEDSSTLSSLAPWAQR